MLIDPLEVLAFYHRPWNSPVVSLEKQSAGWSGGTVWRLHAEPNDAALRLWPAAFPLYRVQAVHAAQQHAREHGCRFIPRIIPAMNGQGVITHQGRHWELADWMPGEPAPIIEPSLEQLRGAVIAMAQWHRSFSEHGVPEELHALASADAFTAFRSRQSIPSPAIARRLSEWRRLVPLVENSPRSGGSVDVEFLTERTKGFIKEVVPSLHELAGWQSRPLAMVLSLPDLHREHVLFSRGQVSGMIDLGGMSIDSAAFDMARYGSSFDSGNSSLHDIVRVMAGAYREVAEFDESLEALIISIAPVSAAIGAFHWWEWLTRTNSIPADRRAAAILRWEELIGQLEQWRK